MVISDSWKDSQESWLHEVWDVPFLVTFPMLSAGDTEKSNKRCWNKVEQLTWNLDCKELIINHDYSLKFNDSIQLCKKRLKKKLPVSTLLTWLHASTEEALFYLPQITETRLRPGAKGYSWNLLGHTSLNGHGKTVKLSAFASINLLGWHKLVCKGLENF